MKTYVTYELILLIFANESLKLTRHVQMYLWFATVTLLSFFPPVIATFSNTNHIRCRGLVFQTHTSPAYDQCLKIICTAATKGGGTTREEQNKSLLVQKEHKSAINWFTYQECRGSIAVTNQQYHKVEQFWWLPSTAVHDVGSFLRFATVIIMIHPQVMAHLMSQHSGETRKVFTAKLRKHLYN